MTHNAVLVYANTKPWSECQTGTSIALWLCDVAQFPAPLQDLVSDWGAPLADVWGRVNPKVKQVMSVCARAVAVRQRLTEPKTFLYGKEHALQNESASSRIATICLVEPRAALQHPLPAGTSLPALDWARTLLEELPHEVFKALTDGLRKTLSEQAIRLVQGMHFYENNYNQRNTTDWRSLRETHGRFQALRRELDAAVDLLAEEAAEGPATARKSITRWSARRARGNTT